MQTERNHNYQDISWFLDLINNGQLDLDPPYQRKSVWNIKEKIFFLDTIFGNYPSPSIFLFKEIDDNGKTIFHVIDGKQRLTTIYDFSKSNVAFHEDYENKDLAGKKFEEIDNNYKKRFWNYSIPVEYIYDTNEELIKSIFDRINRNNKTLTRQELRKAKYDGKFYLFIDEESLDSFWNDYVKFTKRDIARMSDQQFIAELVLIILSGEAQGFNQDGLDDLYSNKDIEFEEEEMVKETMKKIKNYLNEVNNYKNVIKDYYYTKSNLYTLWVAVFKSIKRLPQNNKFGNVLYDLAVETKKPESEIKNKLFEKYASNSKGAITDLKQRKNRVDVILELIEKL